MSKSMGQAIDAATAEFAARYPESDITSAEVQEHPTKATCWEVVVSADLFPRPLTYLVSQIDLAVTLID